MRFAMILLLVLGTTALAAEPAEAQFRRRFPGTGRVVQPFRPARTFNYSSPYWMRGPIYYRGAGPYFYGPGANYYWSSYWYAPYNLYPSPTAYNRYGVYPYFYSPYYRAYPRLY